MTTTTAKDFTFKFLTTIKRQSDKFEGGPFLFHGVYASGKTHLLGDAIAVEKEHGPVIFANVIGEDGQNSAASLANIPERCRVDVANYDAAMELADYAQHIQARLLVVDSLPLLYDLVIAKVTGGKRPPIMSKENNEWTTIHIHMERLMTALRRSAYIVIFSSPSDLGLDLVKEQESIVKSRSMIVPNMRGKYITECVKWFDFVGYLKGDLKNGEMKREVHFAKSDKWLTRQRLPKEITEPIAIPKQGGGWQSILDAINKSYSK